MLNLLKKKKQVYYFLFLFLFNIIYVEPNYITFPLSTLIQKDDFKPLSIIDNSIDSQTIEESCQFWVPSLFYPILLAHPKYSVKKDKYLQRNMKTLFPPLLIEKELDISLYEKALFDEYNLILAKIRNSVPITDCFLGLSKNGNYGDLNENEINLNNLKNSNKIEKKIFSFDKWDIKEDIITTNLYLGDIHQNFTSNNGIVANCTVENLDWGCSFKKMNFNNKIIDLTNINGSYYKIYFSSENHKIIFPGSFRDKFNKTTGEVCWEEGGSESISCPSLFNSSHNYIPLKLINDNMTITTQVDNLYRFNLNEEDNKKTTITFENNIEYFILPLIMFKQFHVQFDLTNNIISFFTTDKSILELIKKKKEDNSPNQEENESSSIGTVFLIIFIIILILLIGFGVFWFINKRKSSADKNINKYNKFEEDDQNFQNMNEKVF